MESNEFWVGLDVSKKKFDASVVCYGDNGVLELGRDCFPSNGHGVKSMLSWLHSRVSTTLKHTDYTLKMLMESTGRLSEDLALLVTAAGFPNAPAILNPRPIKHFAISLGLKNKTDPLDAYAIARYGLERRPEAPAPKSQSSAALRTLLRTRADLVKTRTSVLLQADEAKDSKAAYSAYKAVLKTLETQILSLEKQMDSIINSDASMKRDAELLLSIPGFGQISVFTVLGELADLRLFKRRGQLTAFCGLNPVRKQSGSSINFGGHISKSGPSEVRRVIHLAARAAVNSTTPNPFSVFYNKKLKDGKSKLCASTAVMRKMILTARAILIGNAPFSQDSP